MASQDPAERDEADRIRERLKVLDRARMRLEMRLREIEHGQEQPKPQRSPLPTPAPAVTNASSVADKIALFRKLFAGRTDVFPVRWENPKSGRTGYAPACANEWVRGVCGKPQVRCSECTNQSFIPVTDEVIEAHLRGEDCIRRNDRGDFVAGVYPLLFDDTCRFLAVDFDGESWSSDALAFMATCRDIEVPAALERSRSGNGGHVWLFFSDAVPASEARRLGTMLLTRTMNRRPEIGFKSYDRLFPSQDTMPSGGFGNLIALPLQRWAREKGNSVFVDEELDPYPDPWAFLSSLRRLSSSDVTAVLAKAEADMPGGFVGVRLPVDDENRDEPWKMTPSRRRPAPRAKEPLPARIDIVLADQVYVDRTGLPPSVVAQLVRIAAFQNPEFYRAQAMRLPTYGKPRIVSCAELHRRHVALPRGCLDEVVEFIKANGTTPQISDERQGGASLAVSFLGKLHEVQEAAVAALEPHDFGVLAATTAFGKTVVGARMIAARGLNTLVLVHRRQLVDQWRERLTTFLSIDAAGIGTIGGGKRKPTTQIDIALIQSLVRNGEVSDLVGDYGHLIVDECHHLSAASFEERLVLATGRYLGEGFDDASLDTLFLTMPISWRGTLAQYVGRLHREHHAKREVIVCDYVDAGVPMLARMAIKRQAGYRSLGYEISTTAWAAKQGAGASIKSHR
jgi:hypothetical protein